MPFSAPPGGKRQAAPGRDPHRGWAVASIPSGTQISQQPLCHGDGGTGPPGALGHGARVHTLLPGDLVPPRRRAEHLRLRLERAWFPAIPEGRRLF
ncbi:unnamed protein product [Symbiodinium microadriaticum]|nr:unnamed protein product [Symbiodinium microadriaticum]